MGERRPDMGIKHVGKKAKKIVFKLKNCRACVNGTFC